MSPKRTPWVPRFWDKIRLPDQNGCMLWTGAVRPDGYGQFQLHNKEKIYYAHRLAYEILVGAIPEGLQLDHLCRVRNCVAVSHLEPVTQTENLRRGNSSKSWAAIQRSRTHCKNGHKFSPENTRVVKEGNKTVRRCRACDREKTARYRARRRPVIP